MPRDLSVVAGMKTAGGRAAPSLNLVSFYLYELVLATPKGNLFLFHCSRPRICSEAIASAGLFQQRGIHYEVSTLWQ